MPNKIITFVKVENFRSLSGTGPIELDSSNALFGLNSSGKSNLLRALNWFFNDIVEDGQPISLSSDISYSKKKKRREIKVTVTFDPLAVHAFPKSLRNKWHPTKPFSIIKTVYYKNNLQETRYQLESGTNPSAPKDFVSSDWTISFMSLFKFRYIQAYRNPANLIKDLMVEAQRYLEPSIKQRLTFSKNRATKALGTSTMNANLFEQMRTSVQQAASTMFGDLEDKVKKTLSNVSKLQAGLPENWLTWVKDLGFRFTTHSGGIVDEQAQGAGAQSYLFLLLLCFIAKHTRSYGFGWRQGEIWGIEEPEIYMHNSLAEQCAKLLQEVSDGQGKDDAPIQLLITTHSYPFIAAMKKKLPMQINPIGYTVFSDSQGIDIGPVIAGVLPYTHPLFADAGKRLILVEGTQDKDVLAKYLEHAASGLNVKIVRVSDLTHAPSGNNSDKQMVDYIKKNFGPLAIRAALGGITIVLDNTVQVPQVTSISSGLNGSFDSFGIKGSKRDLIKVTCLSRCLANPELDETFSGIERFLPTKIITDACYQAGVGLSKGMASGKVIYTLPPRHNNKFKSTVKPAAIKNFCSKKIVSDEDVQFLASIFSGA